MSAADAQLFLRRGLTLLDAVVRIDVVDKSVKFCFSGLRVTPELVLTVMAAPDLAGGTFAIAGVPARRAWSGANVLILRTPQYDGSLPELSLTSYFGTVALVYVDLGSDVRQLAFGRTVEAGEHDAPSLPGTTGAPLFDDTWAVVGLHRAHYQRGTPNARRTFIPVSELLQELETSTYWDEVATAHRLVRTAARYQPQSSAPELPALERAVRWDPGDKFAERVRRKVIAKATLEQLRKARGHEKVSSVEQRAVDRILEGPPFAADSIDDTLLLPFATAARWFRGVVPDLPDDTSLERHISQRRQMNELVSIAGPHFAPRIDEVDHLDAWLADPARRALVLRGPGGIGKSALLARFVLTRCPPARFAWIDFDRPDVAADEATLSRIVDEQLAWQAGEGVLILVLDSFESAVVTYGYASLNPALDALARRFPDLAVIVGSRTPVPLLKLEGDPAEDYELAGLDAEVAKAWLVEEQVPEAIAIKIAAQTHGVPLNLRLARDLVKGKNVADADAILASLPERLVSGYLYQRILNRLSDETIKDQAQWAMIPRRLVPDLLGRMLHVDSDEARRLFAALRTELTLLEGDQVLTLRPDLRNTLLPLLVEVDEGRVREIDEIVVAYWRPQAKDSAQAAAEAIYHSLRLGDLDTAGELWRSGVARYLRGYTREEVPPRSRAWLGTRVSHESVEQRVEDLLARGQLAQARAALTDEALGVQTISSGARRRRLLGFAETQQHIDTPELATSAELEAIVLRDSRPGLRIRHGKFERHDTRWAYLEGYREVLQRAIAAVGRVQLGDGTVLGTATLVGPSIFLTTRSVVAPFAVGNGHEVALDGDKGAIVDLRAEGEPAGEVLRIKRIILLHPYWDIALFETEGSANGLPLELEANAPSIGNDVAVIGHPSPAAEDREDFALVYDDRAEVKRLMPGEFRGVAPELSFEREVVAGRDDASPLGKDHGAAVVAIETGRLVGVRFLSVVLSHSSFVPAWELARDPQFATTAGIGIHGTPGVVPEWASTWTNVSTPRRSLLDAYVAWQARDLSRARALLDLVPDDAPSARAKIDRSVLDAACCLDGQRERAAAILKQLVDVTPIGAWPDLDRDAAIATCLRLAVDADAEREFLEILQEDPSVAGLLSPTCFRTLVPPALDLPWNVDGARLRELQPNGGDTSLAAQYPSEAISAATRVVAAFERCAALDSWTRSVGQSLVDLGYSLHVSSATELVAAYVAFPPDLVASVSSFLLEKTDLAPHPTKHWQPIVQPLWLLFRNIRGEFPGVESPQALSGWLDANASSGRLGGYLTELLRADTQVAWAAGLLHLLNLLPIEALLRRRFQSQEAE